MEIIRITNYNDLKLKNLVLALGYFDGFHKAHLAVLNKAIFLKKESGYNTAILTFNQSFYSYFNHDAYEYLISNKDKYELAEKLGFDYYIEVILNSDTVNVLPREFMETVLEKQKYIVCGYDYTFGRYAMGKVKDLENNPHIKVIKVEEMKYNNVKIGSTFIKQALFLGDITSANFMLGRPYSIKGKVIEGYKRGMSLGFPTANIDSSGYILPKSGVYATKVIIDHMEYIGMTNVGNNPTFNNQNKSFETHIIGFNQDLYDKEIKVEFHYYIRDEIKFKDREELIKQLNKDKDNITLLMEV